MSNAMSKFIECYVPNASYRKIYVSVDTISHIIEKDSLTYTVYFKDKTSLEVGWSSTEARKLSREDSDKTDRTFSIFHHFGKK